MIRALRLLDFGKFKNRNFDFAAVTLFFGANESGKSTVFDALFDRIAPPKASSAEGKDLAGRYGKSRKAELDWSDEPLALDPEEFLNLHAVRSGDFKLELKSEAEWTDRIKAGLFSGGLDPGRLAADLAKRADPKGTTSEAKALAALAKEKLDLDAKLARARSEREAVLAADKGRAAREAEAAGLADELAADDKRLAELKTKIGQQRLIREQRELAATIELGRSLREESERLAGLAPFEPDDEAAFNQLAAAKARADQEAAGLRSEQRTREEQAGRLKAGLDQTRSRLAAAEKTGRAAARALAALRKDGTGGGRWNAPALAAAAAALVLGLAVALLVPDLPFKVLGAFAGAFLAFLLVLLAGTSGGRGRAGLEGELRRIWAEETGAEPPFGPAAREELAERLLELEAEARVLAGRLADQELEARAAAEAVESCRKRGIELEAAGREAAARTAAWLAARGVADIGAWQRKRQERLEASRKVAALKAQLDETRRRMGAGDAAALRAMAVSRLEIIERKIVDEPMGDDELKRLENKLRDFEAELESKRRRKTGLDTALAEQRGETRGTLGKLPEAIFELERRLGTVEEGQAAETLARRAAGLAAEIFRELDTDSNIKFERLCRSAGELYGRMVGASRSVGMSSFDSDSMLVQDAGGTARPLKKLSKGTRASFLFAARLALAEGAMSGNSGLLLLDEPFESFDPDREEQALGLLEKSYVEKGRQIVIFTKEPRLRDACLRRFPQAIVHNLD